MVLIEDSLFPDGVGGTGDWAREGSLRTLAGETAAFAKDGEAAGMNRAKSGG
jgi:hypothetical protein